MLSTEDFWLFDPLCLPVANAPAFLSVLRLPCGVLSEFVLDLKAWEKGEEAPMLHKKYTMHFKI